MGVDKDGETVIVKRYSDVLPTFLLKSRKPQIYRDQVDVNVREERRIIVCLLPVVNGPDGRLVRRY